MSAERSAQRGKEGVEGGEDGEDEEDQEGSHAEDAPGAFARRLAGLRLCGFARHMPTFQTEPSQVQSIA